MIHAISTLDKVGSGARSVLATSRWMTELLTLPLLYLVLPPYALGYGLSPGHDTSSLVWGAAALTLLTVWGGILNHYAGWASDSINGKRRWLHRSCKRSDLMQHQWIALTAFLAAAIIGFGDQPLLLGLLLVGAIGASQYSIMLRIEKRLWLSGVYLAVAYGGFPMLVGLLAGGGDAALLNGMTILVVSLLLLLDLGVAPFKDYGDQAGDRIAGKHTLPNVYGLQRTVTVQSGTAVLALIVALLLALVHRSGAAWWLAVVCLALLLLLQLRKRDDAHHDEFLHYAALLSCLGRLILLIAVT